MTTALQKHTEQLPADLPEASDSNKVLGIIERMAVDPRVDPAKLREILAIKQLWEADEARKAFASDMASFQSRCPIITKGDSANGKMYARIDRIHRETRELRRECGFWFTWATCEIAGNIATLSGLLGHRGGHTVPIRQVIPLPDEIISRSGGKAQSDTQRAGSAMTYAKRYGECLALDIVTGEDNDGNTRPKPQVPQTNQPDEVKDLAVQLWKLCEPWREGDTKYSGWAKINAQLYKREILDGAEEPLKAAPNLDAATLRAVISKVKGIL